MKLLIIEDERILSWSIAEYLGREDYLCEQAYSCDEALHKIAAYEYDCILLDLMLPDGCGLDILRNIKKESPQTGVIIVSAKDSLDDKVEGLKIGADDYLPKPFHLPELSMRIFALMRRKKFTSDNGLGLAIAKAVCDVHHWDIEYDFIAGIHQFSVKLYGMCQK